MSGTTKWYACIDLNRQLCSQYAAEAVRSLSPAAFCNFLYPGHRVLLGSTLMIENGSPSRAAVFLSNFPKALQTAFFCDLSVSALL